MLRLEDDDIFDKDENDGNEKSASWYIEAASGGPWRVLSSSPQPRFVPRKKKQMVLRFQPWEQF